MLQNTWIHYILLAKLLHIIPTPIHIDYSTDISKNPTELETKIVGAILFKVVDASFI